MPEPIERVKDCLRQSFLGRAGIHGLGVSRAEQAIRVYVGPDAPRDFDEVLEELRASAQPFPVKIVREDRPRMANGPATGA
jgi:hypothetical protein